MTSEEPAHATAPARETFGNAASRLGLAIAGLAAILFLMLALRQAGKPLQLDSVGEPLVARALVEQGAPLRYRGEQANEWSSHLESPLYGYLLAATIGVFGDEPATIHVLGAMLTLLTVALLTLLLRTLLGRERAFVIAGGFALIYLLQPYTLQVSAIPKIAAVLRPALLVLLTVALLRLGWREGEPRQDEPSRWQRLAPTVVLALLLLADLPLFPLYVLAFPLLLPSGWSRGRRVRFWAFSLLNAIESFAIVIATADLLTGRDSGDFLRESLRRALDLVRAAARLLSAGASAAQFYRSLEFEWRWTGPLPWLVAVAALALASSSRRRVGPGERRLLAISGVATVLAVLELAVGPPSYATVPLFDLGWSWPLLLLPIALTALPDDAPGARRAPSRGAPWLIPLGLISVGFVLALAWARDRVIVAGNLTGRWLWPQSLLLWVPAIVALAALLASRWTRLRAAGPVLVASIALYVGVQGGIAMVQSGSDTSTSYNYGQRGLRETIAFLRERLVPGQLTLCMRDVAYGARLQRYWDSLPAFYDDDDETRTLDNLRAQAFRIAVFTRRRGQDVLESRPRLAHWIAEHASEIGRFGDYSVYEIRPSAAARAPSQ